MTHSRKAAAGQNQEARRQLQVLHGQIEALRKQMTQNDVAVFSFAGHGAKDADGKFYLLPVDGDIEDLLSTAVSGEPRTRPG